MGDIGGILNERNQKMFALELLGFYLDKDYDGARKEFFTATTAKRYPPVIEPELKKQGDLVTIKHYLQDCKDFNAQTNFFCKIKPRITEEWLNNEVNNRLNDIEKMIETSKSKEYLDSIIFDNGTKIDVDSLIQEAKELCDEFGKEYPDYLKDELENISKEQSMDDKNLKDER